MNSRLADSEPRGAVLCDVDGVLRLWPDMTELDYAHQVPAGTLASVAFDPELLQPAITGAVTDEQWRIGIARALVPKCGSTAAAQELVADWTAVAADVDDDVAALLRNARRRVPVVLVSNATTRLESDLAALGVADVATDVVNSARVGVAKPDPRIYAIAAERAGVPAERCLFVDDTAENVAAAEATGMRGVHHHTASELREALEGAGLLC